MLIDDTSEDLYINNRVIQKYGKGNTVNQFKMAIDALEYLQNNQHDISLIPDIIFLDIHMPRMSGFEFLVEYEKLPAPVKSKCVIYMVSSTFDTRDIANAKANPHIKKFFEKPLTKEIVEETVNSHVAGVFQ